MDHPKKKIQPNFEVHPKNLCFVRVCIDKTQVFVEAAQSRLPKDCLNAFTTALEAELRDPKGVATKTARGPRVVGVLVCFRVKPVFYKNLI